MVKAVSYRVEQFLRALTARRNISEQRIDQATRILTPRARALFARQLPQDQAHALTVYDTLCREGHSSQDLLAAALLHDVGKAAALLPAWQRGLYVLVERFVPDLFARADRGQTGGRWRSISDYARHAEIGARWAEDAGCSPLTVALIRRHEEQADSDETAEGYLLSILQAADGAN
ncbi:MAG: hypothetical protein PVH41_00150 [Anaerolineae bacterium]|jgi:hypothetical protein